MTTSATSGLRLALHCRRPMRRSSPGSTSAPAAIARALERSSNLAGVMHLAGHRDAATTSKYVWPTLRAAEAVVEALSGEVSGEKRSR